MAACRVADWDPQAWPLKQAIEGLIEDIDPDAKFWIAAKFFRNLFISQVVHAGHENVARALLTQLAGSSHDVAKVRTLQRLLPKLFGCDVMADRAAGNSIRAWLQARGYS